MPLENVKDIIEKWLPYTWIWAVWGLAMQLNQIRKWEKFRIWMFIANIWLAMWIWYIAWSLIPDTFGDFKYSLISICGFLSHPLLDIIEKRGLSLIIKKILWTTR